MSVLVAATKLYLVIVVNLLFHTLKNQAAREDAIGFSKSIAYYDACVLLNNTDPAVPAARAWVHLAIDQQAEALSWIDKALRLAPENDEYISEKALILWEIRGLDSGLQFVNNSLKLFPKSHKLQKFSLRMLHEMHLAQNQCISSLWFDYKIADTLIKAKVDNFIYWIKELGGKTENVDLAYDSNEIKGVRINRYILNGNVLLKIPLSACIHTGMHHPSKEIAILKKMPDLDPKVLLTFLLLVEKANPHSAFSPYVDLLNNYRVSSPLYYNQQELSMLSGTYALENIVNSIFHVENTYKELIEKHPVLAKYSFDEFKRAYTHVYTKGLSIYVNNESILALVPFIDVLSWTRVEESTGYYFDARSRSVNLEIFRSHHKGQVVKCYKSMTATEYFQMYGIAPYNTTGVTVRITAELSIRDSFKDKKLETLKTIYDYAELSQSFSLEVPYNWSDSKVQQFFSFFRVKEFEETYKVSLSKVLTALSANNGVIPPINKRNEIQAMDSAYYYISLRLRQYPTSVEEDVALMESGKLSFSELNIVKMRYSEKKLLRNYMEYAELVATALDMSCKDAIEMITRKGQKKVVQKAREVIGTIMSMPQLRY